MYKRITVGVCLVDWTSRTSQSNRRRFNERSGYVQILNVRYIRDVFFAFFLKQIWRKNEKNCRRTPRKVIQLVTLRDHFSVVNCVRIITIVKLGNIGRIVYGVELSPNGETSDKNSNHTLSTGVSRVITGNQKCTGSFYFRLANIKQNRD